MHRRRSLTLPVLAGLTAAAVAAAPALPLRTDGQGNATSDGATSRVRVADDLEGSVPTADGRLPGPDVLYDEAPEAPQLQNTGIWEAAPLLVSGATAYRDGEWLYQDWLMDDHGARGVPDRNSPYGVSHHLYSPAAGTFTYPTAGPYVHNAADLVEFRTRLVGDDVAFRVTLTSLVDPELTAFTIALDTGEGTATAWPHGAGVTSSATHFLTVHGDHLELRAADGTVLQEGDASVDLARRQVEARVATAHLGEPDALGVTIGVGLWDAAAGTYLAPQPGPATETTPGGGNPRGVAIVNVGPRTNDQEPYPLIAGATMGDTAAGAAVLAAWWREQAQSEALATGEVTPFHATIDLGMLRSGVTDESGVPTTGALNRILASRHSFGQGIDLDRVCFGISSGIDLGADCEGRFVGQLQSYTVHVPEREQPEDGWGMTLLLHSLSANHNQYTDTDNAWQLAERGDGHLVVTPGGRGPDGFYKGYAEADAFEVWNDVARHYDLDPDSAAVTGYSMGGFGTYRLLARWPDLFESGFSVVGRPGTAIDQLESLRNHRLLAWNAAGDELVQVNAAEEAHQALLEAGVHHDYWLFPAADHLSLAGNDEYTPGAAFLGDAVVDRDPQHVDWVVDASENNAGAGMVPDGAYWIGDVELADPAALGTIDATVGDHERTTAATGPGAGVLTGGFLQAMPYVTRGLAETGRTEVTNADRLRLEVGNVSSLAVDLRRAGLPCDAEVELLAEHPVTVELAGCGGIVVLQPSATAAG